MENLEIVFMIFIWFAVMFVVLHQSWQNRNNNSGFTIIYMVNLFLTYGFAALLYLLPWHRYINGDWMLYGFREATFAAGSFAVGNLILSHFFISLLGLPQKRINVAIDPKEATSSPLPKRYFLIGVVSFIVLPPFLIGLPTITSIMAAGQQLIVVGLCLLCWQALQAKDGKKFKKWMIVSLSLPLISIVTHGFMGVGMVMTVVIVLFMMKYFRPRPITIVFVVIAMYIILSFYLTYMRDRVDIRENLRSGGSIKSRISLLQNSLFHPIWFSPVDLQQLELVDERMNQNILAGRAVEYISAGKVGFANGSTITDSIIALIPRVFWPEKPITAGGVATVSKFTGMEFQSETSVGIGQVMEFYINFGRAGVIVGFLIMGVLVAIVDLMTGYYLNNYNIQKFVVWFLPGMCLLMITGELVEVSASIGASVFLAYLLTSKNLFIILVLMYVAMQIMKILGLGGGMPF